MIQSEKIYIIIPSYNEETVIKETIVSLLPLGFPIVVIDDGSVDNTKNALIGLPIQYIRHKINLGQGAAIQTGINFCKLVNAEACITFDADGQHRHTDILSLIDCLRTKKVDIILGSRFLNNSNTNISIPRYILVQTARFFNFFLTGLLLTDAHNGLRILNYKAIDKINLSEPGMSHATELLFCIKKNNLRYAETGVQVLYTPYSKQKGQKFINCFKIIQDSILNKLFR